MAKYSIEDTTLTGIAGAIREKTETTDTMKPTDMPDLIRAIVSGGDFGGFGDTSKYTVTVIHTATKVNSSNPFLTNWKDYCSSLDGVEFMAFKIQQNFCGIYFRGLCPKYNDTRVGYYSLHNGSYATMSCKTPPASIANEEDNDITINTIKVTDAGWQTDYTVNGKPAIILITRKGA